MSARFDTLDDFERRVADAERADDPELYRQLEHILPPLSGRQFDPYRQKNLTLEEVNNYCLPRLSDIKHYCPTFDYDRYRAGTGWQWVRFQVFERAAHTCQGCGEAATQVHHRDYRPQVMLGKDLAPLISLCATCHSTVHHTNRDLEIKGASEEILRNLVLVRLHETWVPTPAVAPITPPCPADFPTLTWEMGNALK
jgi:hypothetical protein